MSVSPAAIATHVLPHIRKTDSCWFWEKGHGGNGRPYWRGNLVYRLTFQSFRGPIPEGKVLDHVVCDDPRCVNPWHVEPKTQRENLTRTDITANLGQYAVKGTGMACIAGRSSKRWRTQVRNALGQFTGG